MHLLRTQPISYRTGERRKIENEPSTVKGEHVMRQQAKKEMEFLRMTITLDDH